CTSALYTYGPLDYW
nr:immunoglobulin heavy chain junction region [Macaca mulatta]MOV54487.1 immunoglobulin heavy chain junction region [Macaca mulatta]MOV55635.1 immunoglobulin heavy chain junction region [Macaca mulatta]MOV58879.1 immunoglobulin heavy chain junction region [Macaca mulatta]MOV60260.1 immunoglobulin heavy chain junction region [Macaca mulatta]